MSKLMKLLSLVCCLLLIKPLTGQAQICPISIYNSGNKIGLISTEMYNTFVDGNYETFVINNLQACMVLNELVQFTRVTDVGAHIPGAPNAMGIIMDLSATSCGGNFPDNALQFDGTSIQATVPGQASPFLILNFTFNQPDDCIYVPLPVTFVSVTASWITTGSSLKVQWTTHDESMMDHFTVEKSTLSGPWVKVAHVAAQNNTVNNYQWIDNSPINKAIYRITGVDLDCKKTYSKQLLINCTTCPTTFTAPSLTPDCVGPATGPYINGSATLCGTSPGYYKLTNFMGAATVTWSLSNPYSATLTPVGRMVLVTPNSWGGFATLTATVVRNGITYTYTKDITIGKPPINVSYSNNTTGCNGTTVHTATVNPFAGTTGSQYSWYSGGSYIGTGLSKSWTILPGNIVNYQVKWTGPCGQSVYIGSSTGPILESRAAQSPAYTVSRNPAKAASINISLLKIICPEPPGPAPRQQSRFTPTPRGTAVRIPATEVKIYDIYGNLRKSSPVVPGGNSINISAPELPTGLYYLHVIEPGKTPSKLKVWIEQ